MSRRSETTRQHLFAVIEAEQEGLRAMHAAVRDGIHDPEDVVNESFARCLEAVEAVDPRLGLLIGGPADRPEIVITAGGDARAFGVVTSLVGNAPEIPGWFLRAFRPRMSEGAAHLLVIRYGGITLGAPDVSYRCELAAAGRLVDLVLHLPGYRDDKPAGGPENHLLAGAAFLLLDHVLGEYDVTMRVRELTFTGMPLLGAPSLDRLPGEMDDLLPPDVG